jgi:DNA ligase-1
MTLLARLVATSHSVGANPSRLAKIRELAACLAALDASEIETGVLYLSGETAQGKLGIGFAALRSAGVEPAAAMPGLTIAQVDAHLMAVAQTKGAGAASRRIVELRALFTRATAAEREFLVRLMLGELRQGALAGLMIEAIAAASGVPLAQCRRAAMYAPHLGAVARVAMTEGSAGLDGFQLQVLSPVTPMLAQTASDVAQALQQLPGEVAFEWKMDGARIQVHRSGDTVRVYTRSLNDVTSSLPEVIEIVSALPSRDLILDGEAIAFTAARRPQPFQVTMRRFGRKLDVESSRTELALEACFFDCLRLDGQSLADRPTRERYEALDAVVPAALRMPRLITRSESEATQFYAAALAAGHEGLMAKSLAAPYEAGNRGAGWLKIKRAHTLDLVVLAAEWGHGRRTGKLSNLHLGALDPATGEYVMLGKTFKGLTDAMLEWQTREFLAREVRRDEWTVYVRPELVVEVAFSDLQASPRYPGGLALRLARVKRYRDDKKADDADTMETVRRIHAAQH